MRVSEFLDTNVLAHAYDVSDPAKQTVAQSLVKRAVAGEIAGIEPSPCRVRRPKP